MRNKSDLYILVMLGSVFIVSFVIYYFTKNPLIILSIPLLLFLTFVLLSMGKEEKRR